MPFYFICLTFYNWCFHYGCPIMLPAFVLCIIPFPATGQILKTLACYWIFSWNHMFLYVFNLVQTDALSLIICSTEIGVSVSLSYRTSLVTHQSFSSLATSFMADYMEMTEHWSSWSSIYFSHLLRIRKPYFT